MTELRECAWCGLPLEIVTVWTWRDAIHVTARCLNEHWYGGPVADVARNTEERAS